MNQLEVELTERRFHNSRPSSRISQQYVPYGKIQDRLNLTEAQRRIE